MKQNAQRVLADRSSVVLARVDNQSKCDARFMRCTIRNRQSVKRCWRRVPFVRRCSEEMSEPRSESRSES